MCSFQVYNKSDSVIYIYVDIYIFFSRFFFPYRLLQNIEYSSLCYSVGPCWLSILYIAVCICLKSTLENSLVVQWLGLSAFTAGAQVQSLVRELRSRKKKSTLAPAPPHPSDSLHSISLVSVPLSPLKILYYFYLIIMFIISHLFFSVPGRVGVI